MPIPSSDKAMVPAGKVRRYLLSDTHPQGRHKAAFFRRVETGETAPRFVTIYPLCGREKRCESSTARYSHVTFPVMD